MRGRVRSLLPARRLLRLVEPDGIEPTASCLQPTGSDAVCYLLPVLCYLNGGSGWIRTIDPRLIKTVL